jgi:hypothetical protein
MKEEEPKTPEISKLLNEKKQALVWNSCLAMLQLHFACVFWLLSTPIPCCFM